MEPPLQYAPSDLPPPPDALSTILAVGSIALALLAFPLGAITSILLETRFRIVSTTAAERAGFMLFAVMEGIAAAAGAVAAIRARGRRRSVFRTAIVGAALGAIGSAIVLFLIFIRAIN
jgi:hypothetical protein